MVLKSLPKIGEEQIKEQFNILTQQLNSGEFRQWFSDGLSDLQAENPTLFKYIVERAQKFAIGAVMVGDPNSISMSMALEYLLLLNIINAGISQGEFSDRMTKWFKNDDLKGLNDIGKDKK